MMLAPDSETRQESIEQAASIISERLSGPEGAAAADFCRLFYAHVPSDDLAEIEAETLSRQALSAFKHAAGRTGAEPAVRVFNPTLSDDGWRAGHSVVEIAQDDMPFLVDSVTALLNGKGFGVHLVIHPVVKFARADGGIVGCAPRARDGGDESVMQIHIDERTDANELAALEGAIRETLVSVRAAVEDWTAMRGHAATAIEDLTHRAPPGVDADAVQEAADFIAWMVDDHFTFLGYREYRFDGEGAALTIAADDATGIGLLRPDLPTARVIMAGIDALPAAAHVGGGPGNVVAVMKSATRSPVHRPAQMDYVSVRMFDEAGRVVGQRRFVGLFTSTVYTTSPARIPILRRKVNAIVARAGAGRGSHDEKALVHILETFPRDELLQVDVETLSEIASGILNLQERQRTALFTRRDAFDRFVSALVYIPRDRYDTGLRRRMTDILEQEFDGEVATFATHVGDDPLARVHFIVTTPHGAASYDLARIEAKLREASRSWADKLETALVSECGEERGLALAHRYHEAFPPAYRETTSAEMAAHDIAIIEGAVRQHGIGVDMARPLEARPNEVHFKLFHQGRPAPLSDVMPMLEAMGLRILTETPTRIEATGAEPVHLHYFVAESLGGAAIELRALRPLFVEAFDAIWRGHADSDGFNRLILSAGLSWRQVALLRAFSHYLRQAAAPFSIDYMRDALNAHPAIARRIVAIFEARFDPGRANEDEADVARQDALAALDAVESLDEDRILRRFMNLADAALRTNYWQTGADGGPKSYVAVKFDSARVDDLPLPRPMAEIFVFSPRMEGIHLRGGKVARGGIRWSDRREDFRTEILGLMKAQMVKNTVIVPVGAKGGFILKRPPTEGGREALQAEGVECYKTLIRGMLDVTDNIVDGAIVPPAQVVRADGDDPYIVAAADKGTATFSDIANGLSQEYGFWLDDAFASGGSAGYDHKKMGITARGAWESVKRMFLERGKDIQAEPFTVVGCGDMSGDVFGNGMLLSEQIRLIAAFNHMHIIVDPDPDPATSFAERKRMFELPRSAWSDYDQTKLSKGGAVFERSAKSLTLSPEAQAALDAPKATLTPNELINTILKAPVELLWFGGIGNYVKASDESNAEAGDRANDPVRVNGRDVRAKVIGEGANLGVTQLGRVEFAEAGGRINADFIDNSAGVDASDHEVNLKILLGRVVADGDMTGKQRNDLLAQMTEEVAGLILKNNYMQGQALSIAERAAPALFGDHVRFMRSLERQGRLNRAVEYLPDDEEIQEREAAARGLTRPELAVVLSYAKLVLYDQLVESDLAADAGLNDRLLRYFPKPARERFADRILGHQLARELIATILTNEAVDRMGPTFVQNVAERSGHPPENVAKAFAIAVDAFDLTALYRRVEALDGPGRSELQATMFNEITRLTRRATQWLLRRRGDRLDVAAVREELTAPIRTLSDRFGDVIGLNALERMATRIHSWTDKGADAELAGAVARLDPIAAAPDIVHIAGAGADEESLLNAAKTYYAAGERLRLGWCRMTARGLTVSTAWERLALDSLLEDLYGHQSEIARSALAAGGVEAWAAPRKVAIERLERTLDEMSAAEDRTLAMVTVANSIYRGLSAS